MNTKDLNKQINYSRKKISAMQDYLEAAERQFLRDVDREPTILYGMMLATLFIGYKMHARISTLQLIQLPAKIL